MGECCEFDIISLGSDISWNQWDRADTVSLGDYGLDRRGWKGFTQVSVDRCYILLSPSRGVPAGESLFLFVYLTPVRGPSKALTTT